MLFQIVLSPVAEATLDQLQVEDNSRYIKVVKALGQMETALRETKSLNLHKIGRQTQDKRDIWTAYVENNTPGAWRIFWAYSNDKGKLDILLITKHPEY